MNKCENCKYFGKVADAPEYIEKDCMWEILREEGTSSVPPCEGERRIYRDGTQKEK